MSRSSIHLSHQQTYSGPILVVEDSAGVARLLEKILDDQKLKAVFLSRGEDAIRWLSTNKAALLLLDYKLPDYNGKDLIRELRRAQPDLPFIVITGHGDERVAVEFMKLGALDYLVKDRTFIDMLPKVIRNHLSRIVTENRLRELQQEYDHHQAKYQELFSSLRSGVMLLGRANASSPFILIECNRSAEESEKLQRPDCLGRTVDEALPHLVAAGLAEVFARVWRSGRMEEQTIEVQSPGDRQPHWCHFRVHRFSSGQLAVIFDDVTEKHFAELALVDSERRYRSVVEDQTELICRYLADGTLTFVNQAYCSYFGRSPEELLGKSFLPLIPEKDRRYAEAHIASLTSANPVAELTHRVTLPGGEIRWMRWVDRALLDADGKTVEYQAVGQDITEHRRAEEALKQSEALFRTIFEFAGAGMAIVSPDGALVQVNSALCHLLGYRREELLRRSELEITDPEDRNATAAHFRRVIAGELRLLDWEKRFRTRDAEVKWCRTIMTPAHSSEEHSPLFILQVTDISEKRDAEVELRRSEQKFKKLSDQFQTLLDGIPDSLMLISPDQRIVWANLGTCRHFGVPMEEITGGKCHSVLHNSDHPCADCITLRCLDSGEIEEKVNETQDGRRWGVKTFPLKDESGRVTSVIKYASDITEKMRLRNEAAQASRLASLGQLAAGVAHEINNPNALAQLNATLLKQILPDLIEHLDTLYQEQGDFRLGPLHYSALRDELPGLAASILGGTRRISRIVEDLKDFTRTSGDEQEAVEFNPPIQAALRLLSSTLKKATDRLEIRLAPDLPPVQCDPQRIEQVAVNLLMNACQALSGTEQGICLSTSCDREAGRVTLKVRDEGCGIAPEHLAHITDPFFTTKREMGGTGLGLSVSARIVKELGGTLTFESTPGEGTLVTLALPAQREEVP